MYGEIEIRTYIHDKIYSNTSEYMYVHKYNNMDMGECEWRYDLTYTDSQNWSRKMASSARSRTVSY